MDEEEGLRLLWPYDDKHTAVMTLPHDAAEFWVDLTKNKGLAPINAAAMTMLAFKNCCLAITKETRDQVAERDKKNGIAYSRQRFSDWIKESDNEAA